MLYQAFGIRSSSSTYLTVSLMVASLLSRLASLDPHDDRYRRSSAPCLDGHRGRRVRSLVQHACLARSAVFSALAVTKVRESQKLVTDVAKIRVEDSRRWRAAATFANSREEKTRDLASCESCEPRISENTRDLAARRLVRLLLCRPAMTLRSHEEPFPSSHRFASPPFPDERFRSTLVWFDHHARPRAERRTAWQ